MDAIHAARRPANAARCAPVRSALPKAAATARKRRSDEGIPMRACAAGPPPIPRPAGLATADSPLWRLCWPVF